MVIIYLKAEGLVKETHLIINPGKKSVKGMTELFKKIIRRGESIYFEFYGESPREKEIWKMAKKIAELEVLCKYLTKCNSFLSKKFIDKGVLQLQYYYPVALARNFVQTMKERKCVVNVLKDGAIEIFDGQEVITVLPSDKEEKDILKDKY